MGGPDPIGAAASDAAADAIQHANEVGAAMSGRPDGKALEGAAKVEAEGVYGERHDASLPRAETPPLDTNGARLQDQMAQVTAGEAKTAGPTPSAGATEFSTASPQRAPVEVLNEARKILSEDGRRPKTRERRIRALAQKYDWAQVGAALRELEQEGRDYKAYRKENARNPYGGTGSPPRIRGRQPGDGNGFPGGLSGPLNEGVGRAATKVLKQVEADLTTHESLMGERDALVKNYDDTVAGLKTTSAALRKEAAAMRDYAKCYKDYSGPDGARVKLTPVIMAKRLSDQADALDAQAADLQAKRDSLQQINITPDQLELRRNELLDTTSKATSATNKTLDQVGKTYASFQSDNKALAEWADKWEDRAKVVRDTAKAVLKPMAVEYLNKQFGIPKPAANMLFEATYGAIQDALESDDGTFAMRLARGFATGLLKGAVGEALTAGGNLTEAQKQMISTWSDEVLDGLRQGDSLAKAIAKGAEKIGTDPKTIATMVFGVFFEKSGIPSAVASRLVPWLNQ